MAFPVRQAGPPAPPPRRGARRGGDPGLLAEIREIGYLGSANLLVRYLKQGRVDRERTPPSPRRLVSWIKSRPEDLPAHRRRHLDELLATSVPLTALADRRWV